MAVLPILAKPIVIPVAVSSTLVEPTGAGMALRGREYVVATPVVTQVEVVAEVVEAAQVVVVAVVPSSVAATPIQVKPTVIPVIVTSTLVSQMASGVPRKEQEYVPIIQAVNLHHLRHRSSVAVTPIQVKPTVIPAIATNTPVNLTGSGVHPKV